MENKDEIEMKLWKMLTKTIRNILNVYLYMKIRIKEYLTDSVYSISESVLRTNSTK